MMVLVRIDSQSVVMALMQSSGGSRRGFPSAFRDMSLMMQSTCAVLCRAVVDGLAGQQQLQTDTGGIVSFYVTATQTLTGAFIVSFSCPSAYVIRENKFDCFGRKRWKPFPGLCTPDPHHRDAYTK